MGFQFLYLEIQQSVLKGIQAGTLKLAGTEEERIYQLANELLTDQEEYNRMAHASNPYGDGSASERICNAILYHFNQSSVRPDTFE